MNVPVSPSQASQVSPDRNHLSILSTVSVIKEVATLFAALTPFFFLLGGVMLFGFLRSLNLEFLFQASLGSAGGFAAMAFSGMVLAFCFLAFFVLPPAVVITSIQMSYQLNSNPKPRWYAWAWGGMIFLPFPAVFGVGYFGWSGLSVVLILFFFSAIFSFLVCRPAKNFGQISQWLLMVAILGAALVLFFMPMFLVDKMLAKEGGLIEFFAAWLSYTVICASYLMEVQRDLNNGKSLMRRMHLRWVIIVGYLLFATVNVSSMSFLQGVARGAGIMDRDDQAQWYIISDDIVEKQQPQLNRWLAGDKVDNNYIYGQMAYRFADDRVFCPSGSVKDINLLGNCLILGKGDIDPLGHPRDRLFLRK